MLHRQNSLFWDLHNLNYYHIQVANHVFISKSVMTKGYPPKNKSKSLISKQRNKETYATYPYICDKEVYLYSSEGHVHICTQPVFQLIQTMGTCVSSYTVTVSLLKQEDCLTWELCCQK